MKKLLIICTLLFLTKASYSQSANDTLTIDDLYIDFTAPEITAFSILDLEMQEVVTPGSTKEFLTSVLNYVDDAGNVKPGLALEWAPFHTFIKNVPQKGFGRSIRNLSISFATASTDTTSSQMGLGFKWTIYDGTNPYNNKNFRKDLDQVFDDVDKEFGIVQQAARPRIIQQKKIMITLLSKKSIPDSFEIVDDVFGLSTLDGFYNIRSYFIEGNVLQVSETVNEYFLREILEKIDTAKHDEIKMDPLISSTISEFTSIYLFLNAYASPQTMYLRELEKLKKAFEKENWNKPAIQISCGWGFHSDSSFIGDYKQIVRTFAFTSGLPVDIGLKGGIPDWLRSNVRWLFQVKYQNYDNERFELNDQWSIGNRFIFGRSRVRASYEFAYLDEENQSVEPSIDANGWRHTPGIQYKISEDFWTEVAFAGRTAETTSGIEMLPRFTFRRNFRTNPRE